MKIRLHYSLLAFAFIFIFSGLYIEIFLFFLVIIMHELGHVLFLKLFKQKIKTLNITIAGGLLDVEYKGLTVFGELLISLAGVMVNGLFLIILRYLDNFIYQDILINYNILLIVFNLLPIYPLDGYRFIEVLFKLKDDPFKEQKRLNYISIFTLIITFILSIFYFKTLSIVIVFCFLIYHNIILYVNYTQVVLKKYVKRYNYKRLKNNLSL